VADILQATAAAGSTELLLAAVTLHVLIGNGDAHAKNYSLLHQPSSVLELAPLYDLMSTLHYRQDRLAMYVDTVQRTSRVTGDRILNEAAKWGLSRRLAATMVADLLDGVPAAVAAAAAETPGLPAEIPSLVERQVVQIRSQFGAAPSA
jgi:serine/threonine-protein kinase HipA